MDVRNLDLSEAAWLCLGKLAMAVELECGKRFAFRKAMAEIVGLLEAAEASVDAEIHRRRDEFLQAISPGVQRLLGGGGVVAAEVASRGEGPAERCYRGARIGDGSAAVETPVQREEAGELRYRGAKVTDEAEAVTVTPSPASGDAAVDSRGRKRIVYRGKVIYV